MRDAGRSGVEADRGGRVLPVLLVDQVEPDPAEAVCVADAEVREPVGQAQGLVREVAGVGGAVHPGPVPVGPAGVALAHGGGRDARADDPLLEGEVRVAQGREAFPYGGEGRVAGADRLAVQSAAQGSGVRVDGEHGDVAEGELGDLVQDHRVAGLGHLDVAAGQPGERARVVEAVAQEVRVGALQQQTPVDVGRPGDEPGPDGTEGGQRAFGRQQFVASRFQQPVDVGEPLDERVDPADQVDRFAVGGHRVVALGVHLHAAFDQPHAVGSAVLPDRHRHGGQLPAVARESADVQAEGAVLAAHQQVVGQDAHGLHGVGQGDRGYVGLAVDLDDGGGLVVVEQCFQVDEDRVLARGQHVLEVEVRGVQEVEERGEGAQPPGVAVAAGGVGGRGGVDLLDPAVVAALQDADAGQVVGGVLPADPGQESVEGGVHGQRTGLEDQGAGVEFDHGDGPAAPVLVAGAELQAVEPLGRPGGEQGLAQDGEIGDEGRDQLGPGVDPEAQLAHDQPCQYRVFVPDGEGVALRAQQFDVGGEAFLGGLADQAVLDAGDVEFEDEGPLDVAEQVGGRGGRADDVEDVPGVGHDGVVAGPYGFLDERVEFVDGALHEGADHFQEAHVGVEAAGGVGRGHALGPPAPEGAVPVGFVRHAGGEGRVVLAEQRGQPVRVDAQRFQPCVQGGQLAGQGRQLPPHGQALLAPYRVGLRRSPGESFAQGGGPAPGEVGPGRPDGGVLACVVRHSALPPGA
ncbi:hypothetical protein P376_4523 [Streptomyces sp. HCCB10043]|nr:hypothetical protein P376_4523 [Streptomyces sp. HCCB10043]